ncbi:FHIPEP family type III secretion protein, partial [Bacillus licheniformis]
LLNRQETKALIDNVRETAPALVEELIPNIMGVGDVQKVLQKLLKEKISIRNLPTILETLADYGTYTKDTDLLTEYVRQALSRQITLQFANPGEPLQVITAGPSLEKAISDSIQQTEQGNYMAIDPDTSQRIFNALSEQVNRMLQMG